MEGQIKSRAEELMSLKNKKDNLIRITNIIKSNKALISEFWSNKNIKIFLLLEITGSLKDLENLNEKSAEHIIIILKLIKELCADVSVANDILNMNYCAYLYFYLDFEDNSNLREEIRINTLLILSELVKHNLGFFLEELTESDFVGSLLNIMDYGSLISIKLSFFIINIILKSKEGKDYFLKTHERISLLTTNIVKHLKEFMKFEKLAPTIIILDSLLEIINDPNVIKELSVSMFGFLNNSTISKFSEQNISVQKKINLIISILSKK